MNKSSSFKIIFLFKILFSLILIFLCFFSLKTIDLIKDSVSEIIKEEISLGKIKKSVIELAEDNAINNSRGIARQILIYVNSRPEMTLDDLIKDSVFQNIAVQEYGEKSYSAVLSSDCVTVFHINPDIVGMHSKDFQEKLNLPTNEIWENLHKPACEQGIESEGYYTWKHLEGFPPEKKFMRMAYAGETADGKKLYLGATAYVDDFYTPIEQLEAEIKARESFILKDIEQKRNNNFFLIIIITSAGLVFLWLSYWKEIFSLKKEMSLSSK